MEMSNQTRFITEPLSTRSCGECALCCKVYAIPVLDKPVGEWCRHCTPGRGCNIHATRPDYCRDFNCLWMTDGDIPDHWKPSRSKMVLTVYPSNGFLYARVDPGQPLAWTREPYRTDLALWSRKFLKSGVHVLVFVNEEATLIIENEAIPLGRMKPDEGFRVSRRMTPDGMKYIAERTRPDGKPS